jgi:hypothetical protein
VIAKWLRALNTLDPAVASEVGDDKGPRTPSALRSKIRDQMSIAAVRPAPDLLRRVVRPQMPTIVWMSIETVVALEEMTVRAAFVNTTLPQDGVVPEYVVNCQADQADHIFWYQTNCGS